MDRDVLMPIEDFFSITGGKKVTTRRAERGVVNSGDCVEILGIEAQNLNSAVRGLEMFTKISERSEACEHVGLLLRDIDKKEFCQGIVICKPGYASISRGA